MFWDVASGSMMGGYWESHKDDVTSVRFHPDKKDVMASGSTDGQINLFDISQPEEDEALLDLCGGCKTRHNDMAMAATACFG